MSEQPPPEILGALPHRRPQRRSDRRAPSARPASPPIQSDGPHILGTAAQVAAELAEIGLAVGARALRNAIDRLPRP